MSTAKHPLLLSSALAALILCWHSPGAWAQAFAANCTALVQADNTLWWAKPDGSPVRQVTSDSQPRYATALSPDGNRIASSGPAGPGMITITDASGRVINSLPLPAEDALVSLTWMGRHLLRAEEHVGRNESKFHFIDFSAGSSAPKILLETASGTQCALSPDLKDTACITGGADLSLNDRSIYRLSDGMATAPLLQALALAAGTSMLTSTSPAFRVEFQGVSRTGRMNLRITLPDGTWSEKSISPGDQLVIKFQDSSNVLANYAFKPTATGPGVVRVDVRKNTGDNVFEGGIAWDTRGHRLAVVASGPAGERILLVLNRQIGQAAETGHGAIDLQERLPINGPVRSIAFTSDTRLRVVGATQQVDMDIPAQGKIRNSKTYSLSPAPPAVLDVNFSNGVRTTAVKGWTCD